ncbi:MAG: DUF1329 domain-containing protein, partial [Syntrophales bacterium]|nr:DUF1329 domain-containing protein [Syntrophales bacterium]
LIDKNNVELVKEYLTAAIYEHVKMGMVLKIGTQLPPDQLNPKVFKEATERNRGKAVMDKNGVVYYEKIGTLWPGGMPFPNAKNGLEAMGNYHYGRVWDSYQMTVDLWYVNSRGEIYKSVGQKVMYVKCSGRTMLPPLGTIPGYENIYQKRISVATYPREISGLGQFSVRYYDPAKTYDTGFAYLPAFKRTIRVSATTWQDNIAGSDIIYGDGDGFQEPYFDWDLKLIGKKFLLVSEPKSPTSVLDEKGHLSKNLQFDLDKKYPRLGWVLWPVDVVEAIPKFKHVYGKRIVYIPIWPYIYSGGGIVATDVYDRQMKLWKGVFILYGRQHYLNGDPQKPQTPFFGFMVSDLQTNHTTHYWAHQQVNERLDPEDINLGKLLKMGR